MVAKSSEVLVVGAGPVGLFAALCLARQGIRVTVVDEQFRTTTRSYALALHPATLALCDAVGIAEPLLAAGHALQRVALYTSGRRVADVRLDVLQARHPLLLVLPQAQLEQLLEAQLRELGVETLWNHRLGGIEIENDRVTARVEQLTKESVGYATAHSEWVVEREMELRAAFVIGADGHASRVRQELGIPFRSCGPEQRFAIFEIEAEGAELEEACLVLDARPSVVWPLGGSRYRLSFEVDAATSEERDKSRVAVVPGYGGFAQLDGQVLSRLLTERVPWFEPRVAEVVWSLAMRFERRLAQTFGRGRVFLCGDAAHLAPPLAVTSMNLGMAEALELASRLQRVLREGATLESLTSYSIDWRARWEKLLGEPQVRLDGETPAWAKPLAARLAQTLSLTGEHLVAALHQVGIGFTSAGAGTSGGASGGA